MSSGVGRRNAITGYWARSMAESVILRWWHEPDAESSESRQSVVLRWLASCPGWAPWLLLTGLGPTLFAMGASPVTAATFVGVACGAYLFADVAAALFVPVLVWSPKIPLDVWGGESVFIRWDHAIVFGAMLHVIVMRRLREGASTRMLALFLIATSASTWLAYGVRGHEGFASGALYAFQLVYLASIFVVARSVKPRRADPAIYGWSLAVISIAAYGLIEHFVPVEVMSGGVYRTYERLFFDGQSNHIAGFLAIGVLVGIVLLRQERWRMLAVASVAMALAALATTGSREGVAALVAGLAALIVFRFPKTLLPVVGGCLLVLLFSPSSLWYELSAPRSSMVDRVLAWRQALDSFWSHAIFGEGLAARHRSFYDSQYVFLLSETGFVGLILFSAWTLSLAKALWMASKGSGFAASLCVAALAGIVAANVQGLAAVCLLITSIAGPLYWLSGTSLAMAEMPDVN